MFYPCLLRRLHGLCHLTQPAEHKEGARAASADSSSFLCRSPSQLSRHFSENHLCGAKELFASPRKIFRIPSPLYIETLRKSAGNPVFRPGFRFFAQDCVFSPKIGHFAWLASSFSRRSTIDRSCIARRLDVRLTNGRRRMPSLVVGGGVRARKPPSAPSSAC